MRLSGPAVRQSGHSCLCSFVAHGSHRQRCEHCVKSTATGASVHAMHVNVAALVRGGGVLPSMTIVALASSRRVCSEASMARATSSFSSSATKLPLQNVVVVVASRGRDSGDSEGVSVQCV